MGARAMAMTITQVFAFGATALGIFPHRRYESFLQFTGRMLALLWIMFGSRPSIQISPCGEKLTKNKISVFFYQFVFSRRAPSPTPNPNFVFFKCASSVYFLGKAWSKTQVLSLLYRFVFSCFATSPTPNASFVFFRSDLSFWYIPFFAGSPTPNASFVFFTPFEI